MSAPTVPLSLRLADAIEAMTDRLGDSTHKRRYYETWDGLGSAEWCRHDRAVKRQAAALRRLLDALRSAP